MSEVIDRHDWICASNPQMEETWTVLFRAGGSWRLCNNGGNNFQGLDPGGVGDRPFGRITVTGSLQKPVLAGA